MKQSHFLTRVGGGIRTALRCIVVNPMFTMLVLTTITYFILEALRVPSSTSAFDLSLFYFIAAVSFISALFMIARTTWDGWSILGSGLLSHFIAVGMVYGSIAWYANHSVESYTDELLILARSLLIISGVFVLFGVVKEWTEQPRSTFRSWVRRKVHKE